jgi:hypothetical protein
MWLRAYVALRYQEFAMARSRSFSQPLLNAVIVPWNAFVAAFLYYVALTMLAIGVADLPTVFVALTYMLPLVAYGALIGTRAVRALAAMPIDLGDTPHALQH